MATPHLQPCRGGSYEMATFAKGPRGSYYYTASCVADRLPVFDSLLVWKQYSSYPQGIDPRLAVDALDQVRAQGSAQMLILLPMPCDAVQHFRQRPIQTNSGVGDTGFEVMVRYFHQLKGKCPTLTCGHIPSWRSQTEFR